MRTRYSILLLLLLAGLVDGGCNKWLDVKPKDKFTELQLFNDIEGAALTLNGIYLQLAGGNLYGRQLTMSTLEVVAQRYSITAAAHEELGLQSYNYEDSKTKGKIANIWQGGYVVIVNANAFIRNLDVYAGPAIPARYDSLLRGEAMGIRAMMHFDILRMFGPIYNTKDSTAKSIPYYRKAATEIAELLPASQAIDSILADLVTAERLLQADPIITEGVVKNFRYDGNDWLTNRNMRMNYYAVKALQARVHLYRNDKTAALAAAKAVVDNGGKWFPWINPPRIVSDRTDPDRIFSSELLFGLFNIDLYNVNKLVYAPELLEKFILAPNDTRLKAVFENNENDYRYNSMWILPTTGGKNYKTFYKYTDIQSKDSAFRYKMPMIRISEMYYIMAECETDATRAREYFNTVRKNRGLVDIAPTATLATELQKEYQKEFWGEGQLFYYYKRRNITSIQNSAGTTGTVTMNAAKYVFPLPLSETQYR
jgi:hypothetical protein